MGRKHKLKVKGRFSFLMFSLSLSLLDVVILPHLDDVQGWFRVDDFLRDELGDGDSASWVRKLLLEMTIKGRARGLWHTQQFHDCQLLE